MNKLKMQVTTIEFVALGIIIFSIFLLAASYYNEVSNLRGCKYTGEYQEHLQSCGPNCINVYNAYKYDCPDGERWGTILLR